MSAPLEEGVLPVARRLGKLLGAREEVETPQRIHKQVYRPHRRDLWPPDVWAEMQRIANGEGG